MTASRAGGRPRRVRDSGGTGVYMCPFITAAGVLPGKGTLPVSIQNSVQASEYWSARWSSGCPLSCSGAA
ncbi:hypothetical protein APR09_000413 [Nocardia amikacinitolerans]|nr:hypothetical protein [Nocardia amikacinitolerans]